MPVRELTNVPSLEWRWLLFCFESPTSGTTKKYSCSGAPCTTRVKCSLSLESCTRSYITYLTSCFFLCPQLGFNCHLNHWANAHLTLCQLILYTTPCYFGLKLHYQNSWFFLLQLLISNYRFLLLDWFSEWGLQAEACVKLGESQSKYMAEFLSTHIFCYSLLLSKSLTSLNTIPLTVLHGESCCPTCGLGASCSTLILAVLLLGGWGSSSI